MKYEARRTSEIPSTCTSYTYTHEQYTVQFYTRTTSCCGVLEAGGYNAPPNIPKELHGMFLREIIRSLDGYTGAVLFTFVQYDQDEEDEEDDSADWPDMVDRGLFDILCTAKEAAPGATSVQLPQFINPNTGNLITPVMLILSEY